ncbi:MAG: trypsin-like serine protease [Methylocystaceae bacterium]|nr:trypsin-like serine protease [Methylocystaceae bacterium]
MRIFLVLTFLVFSLNSLWAAEPIKLRGIKGNDDRILIENYQYPWSAIGRINKESGGFCTGTLIAPKLVLTAAHCVWNKRRKVWLKPHTIHFLAGYRRGSFIDHAKGVKYHLSPTYNPNKSKTLNVAAKDWVFIELDKDMSNLVGTMAVAPIGKNEFVKLVAAKTNFIQAGYSQDKSHILSVNKDCPMKSYNKMLNIAVHTCDAVHGDSGSPIFYKDKGTYKVGYIHVATTKKGQSQGIAVAGSAIVKHLKKLGYWKQAQTAQAPKKS